jgi:serine/threonine-protein kinase
MNKECRNCSKTYDNSLTHCPDDGQSLFFQPGTVFASKFKIKELIGSGGMAQVYIALQEVIEREIVLKIIPPAKSEAENQLVESIRNEAIMATKLKHPHLVHIYDFGETEDGYLFLYMEKLVGDILENVIQNETPLFYDRAIRLAAQICEGLSFIHSQNLIHGDLKPSNVFVEKMVSGGEFIKILDFGLSKAQGVHKIKISNNEFAIRGTPGYLSPEQILGNRMDSRSDLYSLGLILYELLTGTHPFSSENLEEILVGHLKVSPNPLSLAFPALHIPSALDDLVVSLLSKDPAHRPYTAYDLSQRLRYLLPERGGKTVEINAIPAEIEKQEDLLHADVDIGLEWIDHELQEISEPFLILRNEQIESLCQSLNTVKLEGGGIFILITGEFGTGKFYMAKKIAEHAKDNLSACIVKTRCIPELSLLLGSIRGILTGLLNPSELSPREISAQVRNLLSDSTDRILAEEVAECIIPSESLKSLFEKEPDARNIYLFTVLERFFFGVCEKKPLCVVFEDLHKIDRSSLDFLKYLMNSILFPKRSLWIIGTAIEGFSGSVINSNLEKGQICQDEKRVKKINLEKFNSHEMENMLDNMGKFVKSAKKRITSFADGNPKILLAMVRHLKKQKALIFGNEGFNFDPEYKGSIIPPEIASSIKEKLSVIKEYGEKSSLMTELLKRISLLGNNSSLYHLKSLLAKENNRPLTENFADLLDSLENAGYIRVIKGMINDHIIVKDQLLLELIVEEFSTSRNYNRLQLFTAQVIEEQFSDANKRLGIEIGDHYAEALYYEKAIAYYMGAFSFFKENNNYSMAYLTLERIDAAIKKGGLKKSDFLKKLFPEKFRILYVLGRFRDAAGLLEESLSRTGDDAETALVIEYQGDLDEATSNFFSAREKYSRASELSSKLNRESDTARIILKLAKVISGMGDNEKALKIVQDALWKLQNTHDAKGMVRFNCLIGYFQLRAGKFEEAEKFLNLAFLGLKDYPDSLLTSEILLYQGLLEFARDKIDAALRFFREGLKHDMQCSHSRGIAGFLNGIGLCLIKQGNLNDARENIIRALSIREKLEDRRGMAQCFQNLAEIDLINRNYENAFNLTSRALNIFINSDFTQGIRDALTNMGHAKKGMNDYANAVDFYESALDTRRKDPIASRSIGQAYEGIGDILIEKGDKKRAVEIYKKSIETFNELHRPEEAARILQKMSDIKV